MALRNAIMLRTSFAPEYSIYDIHLLIQFHKALETSHHRIIIRHSMMAQIIDQPFTI